MKRSTTKRSTSDLRLLKGTNQAARHGTADQQVQKVAGRPPCPRWLPPYARAEWRRVLPLLETMGILSKSDQTILVQFCVLAGELRAATQGERIRTVLRKDGTTAEANEPFSAAEHTQLRLCAQQLGLTVLARQSIKKPRDKSDNPFLRLSPP